MSQVVLTDIEGTTSAIDFVHRVLFPYARAAIPDFVRSHAGDPAVAAEIAAVRAGIGADASLDAVVDTLLRWIDEDRKETPLKALQGMVWARGYAEGAFTAHLYVDAWDALAAWRARGVPLYVYSSGSIAAQQLFFRHSVFGDLSAWFRGHFDTTIGGKREAAAYTRIAGQIGRPAGDILFLSDVEAELDAAREAGMATAQLVRPDTRPASSGRHPVHSSFRTIGPT